jgi:hypothetical protein
MPTSKIKVPKGYVYLGRGGTFKVPPTWFSGQTRTVGLSHASWVEIKHLSGDGSSLHYCAPVGSEVAQLNARPAKAPKRPTIASLLRTVEQLEKRLQAQEQLLLSIRQLLP